MSHEHATLGQREALFDEAVRSTRASMRSMAQSFDRNHTEPFAEACRTARAALLAAYDAYFAAETRAHEKMQHRQNVVAELASTESDYMTDLTTIEEVWQAEIQRSGLLSGEELAAVFGTTKQLLMLGKEMNGRLAEEKTKPSNVQSVGAVFVSLIPYFKVYIEYCTSQVITGEIVNSLNKSSKFKDLTERIKTEHRELKNLDLAAYLIKPAQRITKYPLFLKDLVNSTFEDHPDYKNLVKAQEEMHKVLTEINSRTRRSETTQLLNRLAESLSWSSETPVDFGRSQSLLVKEGKLSLRIPSTDKEGNYIMLFDNVLLVLRQNKDRFKEVAFFDVAGLSAKEPTDEDSLVIQHTDQRQLVLSFANIAEKVTWVNSVTETIAQVSTARPLVLVESKKKAEKDLETISDTMSPRPETPESSSRSSLKKSKKLFRREKAKDLEAAARRDDAPASVTGDESDAPEDVFTTAASEPIVASAIGSVGSKRKSNVDLRASSEAKQAQASSETSTAAIEMYKSDNEKDKDHLVEEKKSNIPDPAKSPVEGTLAAPHPSPIAPAITAALADQPSPCHSPLRTSVPIVTRNSFGSSQQPQQAAQHSRLASAPVTKTPPVTLPLPMVGTTPNRSPVIVACTRSPQPFLPPLTTDADPDAPAPWLGLNKPSVVKAKERSATPTPQPDKQ
eukprot:m51a1_g1310 putative domain containing protein (677) ;mRNA; f:213160-216036